LCGEAEGTDDPRDLGETVPDNNSSGEEAQLESSADWGRMSRNLWIGAATLYVGALAGKQFIWHKVSTQVKELRDEDNRTAQAHLQQAYDDGKRFQVPQLTSEQRRKLALCSREELAPFFDYGGADNDETVHPFEGPVSPQDTQGSKAKEP
jgi:hypothetical protein